MRSWYLVQLGPCTQGPQKKPPAAAPAAQQAAAAPNYAAKAGDTLDKLIAVYYKGSPLKIEVLRQELVAANPGIAKASMRLKAGQGVYIPDHAQIMAKVAAPFMPVAAVADSWSGSDAAQRRDWVRFP